ncbi:hypothetical protein K438DRAFT_996183 [Mycena galopus ATCC 62051]|nr:hypothetical protein K438DRAFT_996183 [Mycena galopus ATCC 62051]
MPKSAAELRAHLAEIDEEIIQQGQVLRQLHASRLLVQSQLDSILVYPVLTLPVEITAEIFLHCLPDKNAKVSLIHAPFVLLKVCTRWRDIALSTPRLWATLDVNVVSLRRGLCPGAPSSSCEWTRLAFGWLFRARKSGIPWSVTLRHPSELHGDSHKFQPDLDFLRDIGLQLESLEVYGLAQEEEGAWDPYESRNFTPGSFPLLKCLTIGPAPPERDLHNHWLAFFNDAPQLRQLNLGRILGPIENNSPFPWHQLTTSGTGVLQDFCDLLWPRASRNCDTRAPSEVDRLFRFRWG